MGHGSHYHRKPGSMGTMRPMRVFKGKNLPGHMGLLTVTIQSLEIVAVDLENNCLLVKGNVPGAKDSLVIIKSAVKANGKVNQAEELITYTVEEAAVENEVAETEEATEEVAEEVTETTEVNESAEAESEEA
jgi:large subunit ribosomal protein L3